MLGVGWWQRYTFKCKYKLNKSWNAYKICSETLTLPPQGEERNENNTGQMISIYNKSKFLPRTGHESPEGEQSYSSTLSLTSALDRGVFLTPLPGRFNPGKETRYPLYRRLVGSQGRSGRVRKISPPQGFNSRTVQLVTSRYTYYAILAPVRWIGF